jgi:hypothetical protein
LMPASRRSSPVVRRHPSWSRRSLRTVRSRGISRISCAACGGCTPRGAALLSELKSTLDGLLDVHPVEAGPYVFCRLPGGLGDRDVARKAARSHRAGAFGIRRRTAPARGLLLGYAAVDTAHTRPPWTTWRPSSARRCGYAVRSESAPGSEAFSWMIRRLRSAWMVVRQLVYPRIRRPAYVGRERRATHHPTD